MFKLLKHLSVYLCFGLGLLIGCNNVNTVEGNFSVCFMSEYSEVYFKGDSLRMAAESEWIRRSSWKEFDKRRYYSFRNFWRVDNAFSSTISLS